MAGSAARASLRPMRYRSMKRSRGCPCLRRRPWVAVSCMPVYRSGNARLVYQGSRRHDREDPPHPRTSSLTAIGDPAADALLRTRFIPAYYNQRFAVPAEVSSTAFVPWRGANRADLRCVQEDGVVANDHTAHDQADGRLLDFQQAPWGSTRESDQRRIGPPQPMVREKLSAQD